MKKKLLWLALLAVPALAASPFIWGPANTAYNLAPSAINLPQNATPGTNPASGRDGLYFKSDDNLYMLSSGGTEVKVSTGGTATSVGLSVPATSLFGVSGSPVTGSGTLGLTTTGTSGGVPYFSSTSQLATSALLTANQLVIGGGAATAPATLGSLGTTTTLLHGNAGGAPTYGAVTNADHATMANNTVKGNVSGSTGTPTDLTATQLTTLVNSFTSSLSGAVPASGGGTTNFLRADGNWVSGLGTVTSVGLSVPATSIFGTSGSPVTGSGTLGLTTTGTSGGIPYFSSTSQLATSALLTANALMIGGGAATAPTVLGSLGTTTTLLHGNAGGAPTYGAVTLTTDVTGILPVGNGGTGIGSGTSGGVPYYSGTSTIASSGALAANSLVIGGGAGAAPTGKAAGTDGQFLKSMNSTFINSSYGGPINYIGNAFAEVNTNGWGAFSANNVSASISGISGATITTTGSHGISVGDAIFLPAISGSTGISTLTRYYAVSVPSATTLQLSATRAGTAITPGGSFSSGSIAKIASIAGATGGSPTSTFTRNTSSPIRGAADFKYTAAVNPGEGFSYSFSIDPADQARVLQYSFDYKIASGTFDSSGMQIWIYDVTNSTYIQPTGSDLDNVIGTGRWVGSFQTNSNSTSYRIVFLNVSFGTWNMEISNASIGPQIAPMGSAASDEVAYTPTFTGFGTVSNVNFVSSRVADKLLIRGRFTMGTTTATQAQITIGYNGANANVTASSAKLAATEVVGYASAGNAATFAVLAGGGNNFLQFTSAASNSLSPANGSAMFGSGAVDFSLVVEIPITGWSSNTTMSSDADTRVVAFAARGTPSNSLSAGSASTITWSSVLNDTHGAFSAGVYTVPVTGLYQVEFTTRISSGSGQTSAFFTRNNASDATSPDGNIGYTISSATTDGGPTVSGIVFCNAGDTLRARVQPGGTTPSYNGALSTMSIYRLSGPAAIAATESVNASYHSATGSISNVDALVTYTTKDFDSHNAYSSGTYTAPVSGKYLVAAQLEVAGTYIVGRVGDISIYVNGSQVAQGEAYAGGSQGFQTPSVTKSVALNAGDAVTIKASTDATGPSIQASTVRNLLSIMRVGN